MTIGAGACGRGKALFRGVGAQLARFAAAFRLGKARRVRRQLADATPDARLIVDAVWPKRRDLSTAQKLLTGEIERLGAEKACSAAASAMAILEDLPDGQAARNQLHVAMTRALYFVDLARAVDFGERHLLQPSDPRILHSLFLFQMKMGNHDRAVALLQRLEEQSSTNASKSALLRAKALLLSTVHRQAGNLSKAKETL